MTGGPNIFVESAPLALLALCGALLLHVLRALPGMRRGAAATAVDDAGQAAHAAVSPQAVQAVQINLAADAALPRTLPEFIRARSAELPALSAAALAAELRTSPDTVRRAFLQLEDDHAT